MNGNNAHRLVYLNAWSPVGGTAWDALGVCLAYMKLKAQSPAPHKPGVAALRNCKPIRSLRSSATWGVKGKPGLQEILLGEAMFLRNE